jgi:SNF2 family DNA or RNA helicase
LLLRLRQACCHPHLIKDLSQPATAGIAEVDLLVRAEELDDNVIVRLKAEDNFECPICLEADPNPTIIIPCGHTVCGECVQKLIDPANRPVQDSNDAPRCPHCRGELKAKLITDYKHFCKVHYPERLQSEDAEDGEVAVPDDISDSGSEEESDEGAPDVDKKGNLAGFVVDDDEDDKYEADEADDNDSDLGAPAGAKYKSEKKKPKKSSKGKGKMRAQPKQTLAQLKKESLKSKAAKKRYLRRLDKTYISSAKINRTVELLMEIRKNDPTEKTLIFSQFTSLLDLVEVPLFREKMKYQRYDGSMKMDQRADAVNAFMDDPEQNIMLGKSDFHSDKQRVPPGTMSMRRRTNKPRQIHANIPSSLHQGWQCRPQPMESLSRNHPRPLLEPVYRGTGRRSRPPHASTPRGSRVPYSHSRDR